MKKIVTSSVTSATVLLFIFSGISRLIGFFREVLFASSFGLSNQYDIYLIASVIPITINTIILFIGQNFFIPAFVDQSIKDKSKLNSFLKVSIVSFFLIGIVLTFTLFLLAIPVIQIFYSIDNSVVGPGLKIFKIMIFTIPLSGVISILSAYLQAEKNYFFPAISSLLLNIIIVIMVILANSFIGVLSIAIGYFIGVFFQVLFLIYAAKLMNKLFAKVKTDYKEHFKLISYSFVMILVIESIGQLYSFSDRIFFSQVREGGIAAINYAQTIISLPLSIITLSLSAAIFPKFAFDYHNGLSIKLEQGFKEAIGVTILFFIPISMIFNFMSEDIITLFFQRGAFGYQDTKTTASALIILNYGMIFYALYSIINKVLYGAKLISTLLVITIIGILVKIFSNIIFVKLFDFEGLALGTILSYTFFFTSSLIVVHKKFRFTWLRQTFKDSSILIVNGFLSLLIVQILIPEHLFGQLTLIISKIMFFSFLFLANLFLIKFHILFSTFEKLKINYL